MAFIMVLSQLNNKIQFSSSSSSQKPVRRCNSVLFTWKFFSDTVAKITSGILILVLKHLLETLCQCSTALHKGFNIIILRIVSPLSVDPGCSSGGNRCN